RCWSPATASTICTRSPTPCSAEVRGRAARTGDRCRTPRLQSNVSSIGGGEMTETEDLGDAGGAAPWAVTAAALGLGADGETSDADGVLPALRAAADRLGAGDYRRLDNRPLLELLAACEEVARILAGVGHEVIAQLERQGAGAELTGTRLPDLLVDRLRISGGDARARI